MRNFKTRWIVWTALASTALTVGCSTGYKESSLSFDQGLSNDEPQLQKTIARFCDSAYIAVNQTQEITPLDVMDRYKSLQSMKSEWSSPMLVAELTKAALISYKSVEEVVERFDDLSNRFNTELNEDQIAELTKASIITETPVSAVATRYKEFKKIQEWKFKVHAVEMTKVALFSDRSVSDVMQVFEEFKIRQGKNSQEKELTELTKVAVLTGRAPNEIVKIYDQIDKRGNEKEDRSQVAELTKVALLTNSSAKTVYFRFSEIHSKNKKPGDRYRVMELTKLSLLGKRTADDVLKTYNKLARLDDASQKSKANSTAMTFNMLSGELLQDSVYGENVDECSGAFARLLLSVDSYHDGES
jgi:hypothetical protein